jgi:hypothetical protein
MMAMVEDLADAATCALGYFACALSGTDTYVFSGYNRAFANIAGRVEGVESDKIAGTFAETFGCRSGSLGGAFADIASSAADVTAGAAGLWLWPGLGLGLGGCGLGGDTLAADCEG